MKNSQLILSQCVAILIEELKWRLKQRVFIFVVLHTSYEHTSDYCVEKLSWDLGKQTSGAHIPLGKLKCATKR